MHTKLCLPDFGLKIRVDIVAQRSRDQPGPRGEERSWKTRQKLPGNLNFAQEALRRHGCFPEGKGCQAGGQEATVSVPACSN